MAILILWSIRLQRMRSELCMIENGMRKPFISMTWRMTCREKTMCRFVRSTTIFAPKAAENHLSRRRYDSGHGCKNRQAHQGMYEKSNTGIFASTSKHKHERGCLNGKKGCAWKKSKIKVTKLPEISITVPRMAAKHSFIKLQINQYCLLKLYYFHFFILYN